jgi:hypothetical protein
MLLAPPPESSRDGLGWWQGGAVLPTWTSAIMTAFEVGSARHRPSGA